MAEVLSQDEIDSLLSAISAGEVKASDIKESTRYKKVKIYDFKRPDRLSKDQLRTLSNIHENFARLLNTYLSTLLRTFINVDIVSTDQITYEEFIRSITNPAVIALFDIGGDLTGVSCLEVNLGLVFTIIDRLFGGKGIPIEKLRAITDVEETVVRRLVLRMLSDLRDAWQVVGDIKPKLDFIETNPQFVQIVPPNDMVLLITFEIRIGDTEGILNLCIPYIVLEPIVTKLNAQFFYANVTKQFSDEELEAIKTKLKRSIVPVVAELGSTPMKFRDLVNLRVGDCIRLNNRVDEELKIKIANMYKFLATPGISGSSRAVTITKLLSEEEVNTLHER